MLEYLGGIETNHKGRILSASNKDFRIPRRDWNTIKLQRAIIVKTILEYLGGIET